MLCTLYKIGAIEFVALTKLWHKACRALDRSGDKLCIYKGECL